MDPNLILFQIKKDAQVNVNNFENGYLSEMMLSMTINSIEENKENVVLIWCDPVSDETHDIEEIKEELRALNNFILYPSNIDLCVADIRSSKEEKIFLITGGNNAYRLLPSIIGLPLLDSLFIFPEDKEKFGRLKDDYTKVVNIFDSANDLIIAIKANTRHVNRQMEVISSYDKRQKGTRDLSRQCPNFFWFRLFKDVIHQLPHDDRAKEEMLFACQQYYQDNPRILKDIHEFAQNYHQDDCIRWYTRDTFIYKLINKALRTEDIEHLYRFRYYIADLSRQLAERYEIMKTGDEKKILLYRGTLITTKELEILKANVGKLFAANSYWSTSRSRSYALTFAMKAMHRSDAVAVMYEIECDLEDQDDLVVFADIADLSDFAEEEVLFDAGSIFRIEESTKQRDDGIDLYTVRISTTREGRELEKENIEKIRIQMEEESPRLMLSTLLKRMGKFKKSLQFLQYLRENPDGENKAYILNRIGIALKDDHKYEDALEYLKEAFKLTYYSYPPDKKYAADVLHNQGMVYSKQKNYKKALKYYRRAVTILHKEEGDDNVGIAYLYSSIGRVYRYQGDLEKALEYQHAALDIKERIIPNHVINAFSYTDIANIYSNQKKYKTALQYHLKALALREELLPSDNYNTAWSLHFVGKMYYAMHDLEMARDYYLKSLEIYEKYTDTNLSDAVPQIHQDIARTYHYNTQKALYHRLKACWIYQLAESVDYSNLARLLDDIAFTYKLMGSKEDALKFYQEALRVREEKLCQYTFSLSYSFNNLASLYELMNDMPFALLHHRKALEIYEYHYSYDHWLCKKSGRSIQRVEQRLG